MTPPPAKKAKLKHGIKNKSAKKTTVSNYRPHTAAARDALKKPGTTPPILAFLKFPVGRPRKEKDSPKSNTVVDESTEAISSAAKTPSKNSRTPRGSYQSFKGGDYRAAKDAVMQHLAIHGSVSAAIKHVATIHPTIPLKRQTVNSWHKKMREESLSQTNKDDDSKALLEAFDRHALSSDEKPKASEGELHIIGLILEGRRNTRRMLLIAGKQLRLFV